VNIAIRDVFICHASEDKEKIVGPIVEALIHADISVWYDEAEIKWGDSIIQKVNEGLRISRFVIVVLSPSFVKKNWPQRELNAALNIEASTGEVKVLPLLIGSDEERKEILERYPLLNDKKYLPWDGDLGKIVEALLTRLSKTKKIKTPDYKLPLGGRSIPLPKIKKAFTQREKDQFLKEAFLAIKEYFKEALFRLQASHKWIEMDFSEIHNFKFISKIYVNGEVKSQCKIWIGGISSSNSIAYHSGQIDINNDGSMNDWLSVDDDGYELGLRPSGLGFNKASKFKKDLLDKEESAEYLWMRFTEYIG
jgi:hypothetical protein